MGYRKAPSINEANLVYLVLGIILLTIGSVVQQMNLNVGLLITEYGLILLPVILFLKYKRYSIKEFLRINLISIKEILFIFLIIVFAYPIAVFLNFIVIEIIGYFSDATNAGVPIPLTAKDFFISLFVIGITPGICEEVLFRGLMLNSYEKIGKMRAIIFTAVLFGLFHFNLFNFIGPTFLGVILGILYFKTDSIIASMFGHLLNNSLALTLGYFATTKLDEIEEMVTNTPSISQNQEILYTTIFLLVLSIFSSVMLISLFRHFPAKADKYEEKNIFDQQSVQPDDEVNVNHYEKINWAPIGIVVLIFIFVNTMFFMQFQ